MQAAIDFSKVQANGRRFFVASAGVADSTRPAVLCVHGFPEGWMSWRPLMERLGAAARFHAPDLRGYGLSERPADGYDVFTLTDDLKALIDALQLDRPLLLTHDWGGALGWIFAHRYSPFISQLVVINCTHPRTLVRAVLTFEDFQTLRIPWVPFFQIPRLPEYLLTTRLGRQLLSFSFTLREAQRGRMDRALVDEIVARFQKPEDLRGPIEYYRQMVYTQLFAARRSRLEEVYAKPIEVPITLIWGLRDRALSAQVAQKSFGDAGRQGEWRPLPEVGHFVGLEAPDKLAAEVLRVMDGDRNQRPQR